MHLEDRGGVGGTGGADGEICGGMGEHRLYAY
jgi:hypothetical protein